MGDFERWYGSVPKECTYCGIPEELAIKRDKHRLNVDRLDGRTGYVIDNICLACLPCNLVKSGFLTHGEMLQVGRMFMRPKWTGEPHVNSHADLLAALEAFHAAMRACGESAPHPLWAAWDLAAAALKKGNGEQ